MCEADGAGWRWGARGFHLDTLHAHRHMTTMSLVTLGLLGIGPFAWLRNGLGLVPRWVAIVLVILVFVAAVTGLSLSICELLGLPWHAV